MILNTDYFMLLFIKTLFYHQHISISSILKDLEGFPSPGSQFAGEAELVFL